MDEHRLKMFEKMVLRRMFGSRRDEVTGKWGDNIKRNEMDRECGTYGEKEGCIHDFSKDLIEKDHLEDLCEDWSLILKWIFKKYIEDIT
jgi:hypothetical protein